MCLVLIWRFHSFFDVNAEPQLYWAKQQGKGRMLGPVVRLSAGFGAGGIGSGGLDTEGFCSVCLFSIILISIGLETLGFDSAIMGAFESLIALETSW